MLYEREADNTGSMLADRSCRRDKPEGEDDAPRRKHASANTADADADAASSTERAWERQMLSQRAEEKKRQGWVVNQGKQALARSGSRLGATAIGDVCEEATGS